MDGGPAETLPMPESGAGAYSPDGAKMVYSPQSRDFRTEKRYGGGQANQLYIFDLATHDAKKISDSPRASRDPMWIGDKIYFDSDRDGHFNLYSYDTKTARTAQITANKQWDIRWPSTRPQESHRLRTERRASDPRSQERQESADLRSPFPTMAWRAGPPGYRAANLIEDAQLSPKGERVVFAARGDIFTAPIEKGPPRNLTHSPGRARQVAALVARRLARSPTFPTRAAKRRSGWWRRMARAPAEQLTTGGKAMRYRAGMVARTASASPSATRTACSIH